ncbi:hypothetical protein PISMIDRAFT_678510, partial [Pisolithus microcarpus 441]
RIMPRIVARIGDLRDDNEDRQGEKLSVEQHLSPSSPNEKAGSNVQSFAQYQLRGDVIRGA